MPDIWWFWPYLARLCTKLQKNYVSMTFQPSVSVIKRVRFFPIRVRTQVDGRRYVDTDKWSLPCASEWFASINGHGYTDTGVQTRTGVAWPLGYVYTHSTSDTWRETSDSSKMCSQSSYYKQIQSYNFLQITCLSFLITFPYHQRPESPFLTLGDSEYFIRQTFKSVVVIWEANNCSCFLTLKVKQIIQGRECVVHYTSHVEYRLNFTTW